uniref:NADH-ubiquinone oxidoreductase chain 1 n=1 Tax=Thetys vagina TaxID=942565 RepID=A0AA86M1W1_9UROC|nr:NADH dehydrogenase subunit 1 [Thetys vagina]
MFLITSYFGFVVAVAFLVLTERAVLGLAQIRKGPNLVGPWGVIQCVTDGVKLMTKGLLLLSPASMSLYALSPVLLMMLIMFFISCVPMPYTINSSSSNTLLLFCVLGLLSLPFMLLGFCYGSVYSTTGSVRVVGLMMSYEILMLILIMFFKGMGGSWDWDYSINLYQTSSTLWSRLFLLLPLLALWLMELGRTPFDLAEGESELVSGFNVEYGGWGFLLFFFSEMLALLMMSLTFSLFSMPSYSLLSLSFFMSVFVILSLYVRAALPRFRLIDVQNFIWFRMTPLTMGMGSCMIIFMVL